MARNSTLANRFPAYYRHDLLTWRRKELGLRVRDAAKRSGVNRETVRHVFRGSATSKHVYPVAKSLGLDWTQVHNLKLKMSDFHLAVTNGSSGSSAAVK